MNYNMNGIYLFNRENLDLLQLNQHIHGSSKLNEYHINHLAFMVKYAEIINSKFSVHWITTNIIEKIVLAHDLFKERSLIGREPFTWNGIEIPLDLNRYVRMNLGILESYGVDEFFNSDMQLHPQAAAIFLIKEMDITDPAIIYPVLFHSCPIISVYKTLDEEIQRLIDIILLSDKLSSNYLRINRRTDVKVRIDLDQTVFGDSGREFNYTLGLFVARLIAQGSSTEEQTVLATQFYYERLRKINPLIKGKYSIKMLGGNQVWPKRESQILQTP